MNFASLKLSLASPEKILSWSFGEITKPETINYRTQKPEKDGLFSEAIFGPVKDFECYCGKYRRIRYKGIICDRCGVEVTRSIVRRERMGHITLSTPVAHIWFLRSTPSRIGILLDMTLGDVERVVYFAAYVVMKVNEEAKVEAMRNLESEFRSLIKSAVHESDRDRLDEQLQTEKEKLKNLKRLQVLSELEYREMSLKYGEVFQAGIGATAIKDLLTALNLEEEVAKCEEYLSELENPALEKKMFRRMKILKSMIKNEIRPEWMILTQLPVIPPMLRPMVQLDGGRFATSDLNDLYRRVINRNNRLKHLLELRAPDVITKNEKRMLQESVDALIDNAMRRGQAVAAASTGQKRALKSLSDMLKGKQGRFRQNLLGKRVDYSGRSVIVIGPTLGLGECGLPKYMALELFKPFVINYLISKGYSHNIRSSSHLIEQEVPEVWEGLEHVIQNKYVLLNRAPTLHRLSVQAFKPVLIEGKAIRIPPLPTSAFNADFDGDQMAVHLPLTDEAQKEAKELMLSTHGILKPATGEPVAIPTRDIVFGCFYLTSVKNGALGEGKIFSSEAEAQMALDHGLIELRGKIKVRVQRKTGTDSQLLETSIGRIIFNKILPEGHGFLNKAMPQNEIRQLEAEILHNYGEDEAVKFLDQLTTLGFHYFTVSGISWGIDDLKTPASKPAIIAEAEAMIDENKNLFDMGLLTEYERKSRAIQIWTSTKSSLEKKVIEQYAPEDVVSMMVESKARGNWPTTTQLAGMRGLMARPDGEVIELPVKSCFKEGINVLEYFLSTHGARKGTVDTALKTASAGYLTRRLVDVAQDVVIREEDCGDNEGYIMYAYDGKFSGQGMGKRLKGRYLLDNILDEKGNVLFNTGDLISSEDVSVLDKLNPEKVRIRSLMTCKTIDGLCRKCYGYDLSKNKLVEIGEAVGIVTAQSIGEPGTQLTMRTFHTGGVASSSDITAGLPRVEEIFEVRPPSARAVISDIKGRVTAIQEKSNQFIIKLVSDEGEEREYATLPGAAVAVSAGDLVTPGQQLSDGHVDLRELFETSGDVTTVARYIIREAQSVYFTTGSAINEKHLEIIVRQVFSRVMITSAGDTDLLPGDVIEKRTVMEANHQIKINGGTPAEYKPMLNGITRVSLSTDSYLSSASFQETARVLIDAALSGREDPLRGLKENVIIGRIIPAGTGYGKVIE